MKVRFSLLLVSLILLSCTSPRVLTDYAPDADFDNYKSFAFYAVDSSGLAELDEDRVYLAIKDTLIAKGFEKKLIPDFKVNFYADVFDKVSNSNFGIGFGGYAGSVGGMISPQVPKRTIALTIEFADGLTNDLFWQGVVEASFEENLQGKEREAFFNRLVGKVLEKYPPEK